LLGEKETWVKPKKDYHAAKSYKFELTILIILTTGKVDHPKLAGLAWISGTQRFLFQLKRRDKRRVQKRVQK
jgi:hypothetical protein